MRVSFTIPGIPRGKGRPRAAVINGRARIFTPKQTADEETNVRWLAHQAMRGRPLIEDAARLTVTAYLPIPKSWSQKKQTAAEDGVIYPTTKPDADNILKLIADATNGVVWRDDSQVVDAVILKRYSRCPSVVVEIETACDSATRMVCSVAMGAM